MVSISDAAAPANFIALAADIVSAYVAKNSLPASELPALINDVHAALVTVATGTAGPAAEARKPAVPIRRSITPDYIICLDDGKKF
jgi:predicted transcriptional regulator